MTPSKGIVVRSIKRYTADWLRKATVIVWDLVVFTLTHCRFLTEIGNEHWNSKFGTKTVGKDRLRDWKCYRARDLN